MFRLGSTSGWESSVNVSFELVLRHKCNQQGSSAVLNFLGLRRVTLVAYCQWKNYCETRTDEKEGEK
jgi:hypothetical protein